MKSSIFRKEISAEHLLVALQLLAFGLVLFGVKLWIIATYGNGTPFWDQWDAEAANLYDPFLQGRLSWLDLISSHNEHRILTTRLVGLALLQLNGLWSPLLEMVVNAAIHVCALGLMAWLLARTVGRQFLPVLLVFVALVFAVPYAWENTLAGFQTQFYLVLLFSISAIWLLVRCDVFSRWWWAGLLCCVAAYFSLASGLFAAAAAGGIILLRNLLMGHRRKDFSAVGLLAALFVAGYLATPVLSHHADLKASGLGQFAVAFFQVLAWPTTSRNVPTGVLAAILRNLPWLVFAVMVMRRRIARDHVHWFLLALGLWVCGQAASIAYGRAPDTVGSRYLDLHAMALLVDFAALVAVMSMLHGRLRKAWCLFALIWLVHIGISLMLRLGGPLPMQLESRHQSALVQERNVRSYLATHDRNTFLAQPFFHLPYPDGARLAAVLDSPVIQAILPENLQPYLAPQAVQASPSTFSEGGVPASLPDCQCGALGSYGRTGNAARGEMRTQYLAKWLVGSSGGIAFLVAGPLSAVGAIDVIQNGVARPVVMRRDPGNNWAVVRMSIDAGPFEILVRDPSAASWVAVGRPVLTGRLDRYVAGMLYGALLFVAVGLVLTCLSQLMASLDQGVVGDRRSAVGAQRPEGEHLS